MQYHFKKVKGRLVAVITDPEETRLFKKDLEVENLKTYSKCSIDDGFTRDIIKKDGKYFALISSDKESLLGEYDISDLRLYARKKPKLVEEEYDGFD